MDPRSVAVGETYGKSTPSGSVNPGGVELGGNSTPLGSANTNEVALPVRRFHLRLMIFMPFGHGRANFCAYSSAYAPLGERVARIPRFHQRGRDG